MDSTSEAPLSPLRRLTRTLSSLLWGEEEGQATQTGHGGMGNNAECVQVSNLRDAAAQAESERDRACEKLASIENEWNAQIAEFTQKNAQLRVDAKSANRRVAVLEEELAAANKRIDELEHALLEARHQNGVTTSPAKGKLRG